MGGPSSTGPDDQTGNAAWKARAPEGARCAGSAAEVARSAPIVLLSLPDIETGLAERPQRETGAVEPDPGLGRVRPVRDTELAERMEHGFLLLQVGALPC